MIPIIFIFSLDQNPISDYNSLKIRFRTVIYWYKDVRGQKVFCHYYGLSECALWILYPLRVSETPVTQSDICGVMFQPKQTVNSALKKLKNEGYIKLNNATNKRFKEIYLTESGITLAQNTVDHVILAEIEALSTMSSEEFTSFLHLLGKYTKTLKHQMDKVKPPTNNSNYKKGF